MKGEATSVAIIELPEGRMFISGFATKPYMSEANGMPIKDKAPKKIITFSNRVLSSNKWFATESLVVI